jgi:hypothetical protein
MERGRSARDLKNAGGMPSLEDGKDCDCVEATMRARKESIMTSKTGQPLDEVWSAPESGTVRDDTSGNAPSDRGFNPGQGTNKNGNPLPKDDPSVASEER